MDRTGGQDSPYQSFRFESLFTGAILAISSTTIIAKAFDEQGIKGRMHAPRGPAVEVSKPAREGRFDYLLVESTGIPEPLPLAEPRLGRRTVLTFPLLPPPQKN